MKEKFCRSDSGQTYGNIITRSARWPKFAYSVVCWVPYHVGNLGSHTVEGLVHAEFFEVDMLLKASSLAGIESHF